MAVSWTEAQADAISARKGSVLVAAAAGSSKTAVLVQRAIERLTDPGGLTWRTGCSSSLSPKAAAAEMRARLERRLYEMLREHRKTAAPSPEHFCSPRRISERWTAFCAEMVREFFMCWNCAGI